jgi:hypothetical protein
MSHPYDATTKFLLEFKPSDWLDCAGLHTTASVRVVSADLSTVTTDADSVFLIEEPKPWMAHFELQSSYKKLLSLSVNRYNVLIEYDFDLPVVSVLVLLRPEADGPGLTGVLQRGLPNGFVYDVFHYRIIRVWQEPVETFLDGGLATLPLAPLANVKVEELPAVIQRMTERIAHKVPADEAKTLWTATYVLLGLKYSEELIERLFSGVVAMEESVTYQKILKQGETLGIAKGMAEGKAKGMAEGKAEEAHRILLRIGRRKFGIPGAGVQVAIEAISDIERLETLAERVPDYSHWEELLASP